MLAHAHNLGDNSNLGPINTEDFRQFLQIDGSSFTYAEDSISQPGHTQIPKLFVKERFPKLCGK